MGLDCVESCVRPSSSFSSCSSSNLFKPVSLFSSSFILPISVSKSSVLTEGGVLERDDVYNESPLGIGSIVVEED